ncbi:dolichol kinase [Paracoccidioides brasiliensis Pb18]|uniref:dolichol kinase n=1 Tax=Paracoccidioides brasiliensis (strain Pb18) TaxID=502780 RepID=C1G7K0_PARBD|nr:dolichol kinase [Paracoccidioides brasiliensis Pb18]EEH47057.2 hypothetical protein PADG_03155 [Paracoccidioides brasiliensis Pb18]
MAAQDAHRGNNENNEASYMAVPSQDARYRQLSRSPHPYHRCAFSPVAPGATFISHDEDGSDTPPSGRSPISSSDSGTEADDESTGFLKGLPAPQIRSRRILGVKPGNVQERRGGSAGARIWSAFRRSRLEASRREIGQGIDTCEVDARWQAGRRVEALRRLSETTLVLVVGATVYFGNYVRFATRDWDRELSIFSIIILGLYLSYPFRIFMAGFRRHSWKSIASFPFSTDLDPAPLIYPVLLPVLIALSLVNNRQNLILPNIILGLSSIPLPMIPLHDLLHGCALTHWAVAAFPIITSDIFTRSPMGLRDLNPELLLLIFPLHQALVTTLNFIFTTSLLPTELQLLATGLINILLFTQSPQAEILKALLWIGGICMLILCRQVLHWEVVLARVPSWKFSRTPTRATGLMSFFRMLDQKLCCKLMSHAGLTEEVLTDSGLPISRFTVAMGEEYQEHHRLKQREFDRISCGGQAAVSGICTAPNGENVKSNDSIFLQECPPSRKSKLTKGRQRRQSLNFDDGDANDPVKTTPGGRRKRLMTPNLQSFTSLTFAQAHVRKWAYALYVYEVTLFIIFLPVRRYIGRNALHGNDPFGWAIGYLFGNIPPFRFWLVRSNMENWVRLPPLLDEELKSQSCRLGWVDHLRQDTFGEANTRLLIAFYCVLVIVVGLALVVRLSGTVEVDTRRKVFHGMMVLTFLPTTFIDPTFTALALALILAVFLLLDLFRASQLPPISRPLTYFLAPYVDGRDHRGPVIVSHIFLLIGCAIPLWLSLAGIPRSGIPPWDGWEVETRDLSMVTGIIGVGMGDAAASLVGRRYGRRRWFWGGGKSIEGSVAFAAVVFVGILVARTWLILGGWDRSVSASMSEVITSSWARMAMSDGWATIVGKSLLAAFGSSFTEAVLTGGNDNVVVPLVLWLLVRGLGL